MQSYQIRDNPKEENRQQRMGILKWIIKWNNYVITSSLLCIKNNFLYNKVLIFDKYN